MLFESERQSVVFVKASDPTRGRSITLTFCLGLHKLSILWCTLDVTQLSASINPLSLLCIPLQHPKLPHWKLLIDPGMDHLIMMCFMTLWIGALLF